MLANLVALGWRLAAQMAHVNFCIISSHPDWTLADVEIETEWAIERMELRAHDLLAIQYGDPGRENWRAIWAAMEAGYRETTTTLLRTYGYHVGDTLH